MQTDKTSVIARKLGGRRVGRAPIRRVDEIGENFARILDERLRALLRTIVRASVADCEVRRLSRALERIPAPAMMGVVAVSGAEPKALASLSGDLVNNVVDLRLGGDPATAPRLAARPFTAIDGALCVDFVAATISAFEGSMRLDLGAEAANRMRFERFEQHASMIRIAPEHSDALALRLDLEIGEAGRRGALDLVLPLAVLDVYRAASRPAEQAPGQGDLWSAHMARAALAAPVRLDAVLERLKMSVSELEDLRPGSVIPLSPRCRGSVSLAVQGGGALAAGRLGAADGRKAVKLADPPPPELVERIRALAETEA